MCTEQMQFFPAARPKHENKKEDIRRTPCGGHQAVRTIGVPPYPPERARKDKKWSKSVRFGSFWVVLGGFGWFWVVLDRFGPLPLVGTKTS